MEAARINILLLENNSPDSRRLREFLSESSSAHYELFRAQRLDEALQHLGAAQFDIVLADLSLPDSQGLETFRQLHGRAPGTPIIVLSGSDDETMAAKAVREGAQDYLVKGRVDAHGLSRAIIYALERHQAERALLESEKHFKHLLESITDYSYTVEVEDGRAVRTIHGQGCFSVTGYRVEDYRADPELWHRMVLKEDRPAVVKQAEHVLAGEDPPPLEHRIIHKSGQTRWVRNTIVPRFDQQGRLSAYDGLIADITERKRAEEKLVNSEALYHSLVESLPQNIFRKDLSERFIFANQRFCAMLGKPLEEIIGKTDFDFFPAALAEKYQRDDRFVIQTGETFETVEENQTPQGEKIYVNVVKSPIHGARGQIIGIQGIFWDITERKRAEEQLHQAHAELARSEQALRKSHEDLKSAQLQLIQAEKMDSVGTLAAGVAHEVKNPLAILMMGLNYLVRKLPPDDENFALVLKEMKEAIGRADSITRGLLDFSASGQLAVQPEDLTGVIEDTLRFVRHELKKNQITLARHWGKSLPPVRVDRNQLQQVFVNVFMNAIQAMPEGGTLTVRTYAKQLTETRHYEGSRKAERLWVGDQAVVAEVEDTGGGIAEEYLARIYDPFFTTKPTGVGTGLGLSVSRKIIELHGGTIDINNLQNGGVKVTITLRA